MLDSLILQIYLFPGQVWQSLRALGQTLLASLMAGLVAMLIPVALLLGLAPPSRTGGESFNVESWATLLHPIPTKFYEELPPVEASDRRGAMAENRGDRKRLFDWVAANQPDLTSTILPNMVIQLQAERWTYQTLLPNSTMVIEPNTVLAA